MPPSPNVFSRQFVVIGLALILAVPASSEAQKAAEAAERASKNEYVIGAGDVLEVSVWNNALVSRTVPVRPDGKISIPILNDVQAAGLTPMQLQSVLTQSLAEFIQPPEVAVIVREVHSFKVSVIGQVKTPGRYDLTGRVTVLDALAMAGGLTEYADRSRIVVLRREGPISKQIPFAYDKVTPGIGSTGQENFRVLPDDIILVR